MREFANQHVVVCNTGVVEACSKVAAKEGGSVPVLLRIEGASRVFRMGEVEVPALTDADLTIEAGEFIVILGPSGSGKTTLINLIGGLDRPTSGRVWHRDTELTGLNDEALTVYRRETVGFIFQFYNLVPTLTAYENVQVATELVDDPLDPAVAWGLVGLMNDDRAQILEGLTNQDAVAARPSRDITEGMSVRTVAQE